ncbi:MAG TPA: hypothetical protein VIC06_01285 [Solirubrobacteraceae bacterium]|jgi:hypothetical protein
MATRRIKVKGVKKRELSMSTEELSYLYYLMGKSELRARREREAREKAKRRERKHER